MSKTTFYRYFESKEDVLIGSATEKLELMRSALLGRPAGEPALDAAGPDLPTVVDEALRVTVHDLAGTAT